MQVIRNMGILAQHRTSCVKQCYSICAYILYSIVYNPQKVSILYLYIMLVQYTTLKKKYSIRIQYTCITYIYNIHAYPSLPPYLHPLPPPPPPFPRESRNKIIYKLTALRYYINSNLILLINLLILFINLFYYLILFHQFNFFNLILFLQFNFISSI